MLNSDLRQSVEMIFTPAYPATGLTFARRAGFTDFEQYLAEPGSQILIYGQTGVGKTSLAINGLLDHHNWIRYQCHKDSTFEGIIKFFVENLLDPIPSQVEVTKTSGGELHIGLSSYNQAQVDRRSGLRELYEMDHTFSPEKFIFSLAPECWKLVIDDFERVSSLETKIRVAQLTKSFSDQAPLVQQGDGSHGAAKLIIVGSGSTMGELLDGDPSNLGRVMSIHLKELSDQEVRSFLERGFDHLKIKCHEQALESFVLLAAGYPRYAHALALEACREAERLQSGRLFISREIGTRAVYRVVDRYEPTFGRDFDYAVRSRNRSKRVHAKLVQAIANIRKVECDVAEIFEAVQKIDPKLELRSITAALGELASKKRGNLLKRPRSQRGVYAFNDALMKSFVRLKHYEIQLSSDIDY